MTQFKVFFLFIFQIFTIQLIAQNHTEYIIENIYFDGLQKTKNTFLSDIIETEIGSSLNVELIQTDIQKLKNISGIGYADYSLDTIQNKINLTYKIEEVKTLLPIVKFGGIKNNIWLQVGFVDINWQGKGQTLSAYYQNNDSRHSGQIYYRIPQLKGKPWGFSASLTKWSSREPLYFPEGTVLYDYDNNSLALTAIRRFGYHRNLEFGGTYFIEKYSKSANQSLENTPGPASLTQPKWLTKLEYSEDFLNYNYFYLNGLSWKSNLQNVYNTLDKTWFHSLQFQARQYFQLGEKNNIAIRLRAAISTNNDTPFAPFVADSHVNLRGVGNRIDRGTAQLVLNAEYRRTIYHGNKWAAQAVAFSDLGTWRNPGGELKDILNPDQFRQFLGGGFRLIYQKVYGAVLRVDYGIDIFNPEQRGFVIGLGQYF